jgi:hypothetical protein
MTLRDALRHLVEWSEKNRRAFRIDELPGIFQDATGGGHIGDHGALAGRSGA